ncbi:MAG: DUF983 domain-containing protein [Pseudomonadota bacterium]
MAADRDQETSSSQKASFLAVSLYGRCPRCNQGHIFEKLLGLKDACPNCGLDLAPYDQADGPAFFVILIAGALMTPIALWLHGAAWLSWGGYLALITVLTAILVVFMLRLAKGILLASQYKTGAREGRIDTTSP